MTDPVVYCVTPEVAATVIEAARELGAPIREGDRSGDAWQFAVGYVVATALDRLELERAAARRRWQAAGGQ
jgi:hypothetical protein